jgi:peptidyl-prolyl cis-trans isomerase SurA
LRALVPTALACALATAPGARATEHLVDGIAAQVGPDVVLVSEVNDFAAAVETQVRSQGGSEADLARMKSEILERLIERRLIEQVVKRAELQATDAEVDSTIKAIAEENGISQEQLKQSVEANGLTMEAYRERIRGDIQRTKVLNVMVRSRVKVDETEVRKAYDEQYSKQPEGGDELHLRHLLVTFGGETKRDEATACGAVKTALAEVRSGKPFEQVAAKVSEMNPERGGDVGWVPATTLAPWMTAVVSKLQPGQTSDVIRMPFGCNLLQLVERREFRKKSYEEVKPELQAALFEQKTEGEYVKFVNKLRGQTYIERKDAFAAAKGATTAPSLLGPGKDEFSEGSAYAP